jgi:hypothetical protein
MFCFVLLCHFNVQVGCLCVWEHSLYVGTQCGLVIYYFLEEHKTPLGKPIFQSRVKGRIQLGAEKVCARYVLGER